MSFPEKGSYSPRELGIPEVPADDRTPDSIAWDAVRLDEINETIMAQEEAIEEDTPEQE